MCKIETDVHRRAKLSWATQSPFNLIISEAPIANLQGDCSGDYEDWISGSKYCYMVERAFMKRSASKKACESDGAELIRWSSKQEYLDLGLELKRRKYAFIWTDYIKGMFCDRSDAGREFSKARYKIINCQFSCYFYS